MFSEVTILLALTVFHTIFTGTLPQVSDRTPLLGRSATMSCTFLLLFFHLSNTTPLPGQMQQCCALLCLRRPPFLFNCCPQCLRCPQCPQCPRCRAHLCLRRLPFHLQLFSTRHAVKSCLFLPHLLKISLHDFLLWETVETEKHFDPWHFCFAGNAAWYWDLLKTSSFSFIQL